MARTPPKPVGSSIEVIEDFDGRTYRWKPPSGGPFRIFIAGFLMFWLCGWTIGLVAAIIAILNNANAANGFLVFWLVGWTLGGLFAISMLYILLRAPHPESITLSRDSLSYDSGTLPPTIVFNPWYVMRHFNPNEVLGRVLRRRKQITINRYDLDNVVLERIGERQRLYFDHGADRVEIGEFLREPDREWLADVIEAWKVA